MLSLDESPHLPHGYAVIIFLSFFPSKWFEIMDPLVDEYDKLKTGNISGKVMEESVRGVRRFILTMGLYTLGLVGLSTMV